MESGVLFGSTNMSSPEKYFGRLWFRVNDPLNGIDIPHDLGNNRCKSIFPDTFRFSEVLVPFETRSCNR